MFKRIAFSDCSREGKLDQICDYFFGNPLSRPNDAARHYGVNPQSVRDYLKVLDSLARKRADSDYGHLSAEERVGWLKDYFVNQNGVDEESLVKETGLPAVFLKKDLERAGICLMKKRWHLENAVLQKYNQGIPSKQIAYELKISGSYVRLILNTFGLSTLERRKEAVLDSFKKGNHSPTKVANALGICEETARKWMKRLHL